MSLIQRCPLGGVPLYVDLVGLVAIYVILHAMGSSGRRTNTVTARKQCTMYCYLGM